jgi:hypothetical protein
MTYTYDSLKHQTVAQLREIAAGLKEETVQGYTQLNKEHLLVLLCKALHIDTHIHHHVKATFNKAATKSKIKKLKAKRDEALQAHDHKQLKTVRRDIHQLKREIRKATD